MNPKLDAKNLAFPTLRTAAVAKPSHPPQVSDRDRTNRISSLANAAAAWASRQPWFRAMLNDVR